MNTHQRFIESYQHLQAHETFWFFVVYLLNREGVNFDQLIRVPMERRDAVKLGADAIVSAWRRLPHSLPELRRYGKLAANAGLDAQSLNDLEAGLLNIVREWQGGSVSAADIDAWRCVLAEIKPLIGEGLLRNHAREQAMELAPVSAKGRMEPAGIPAWMLVGTGLTLMALLYVLVLRLH